MPIQILMPALSPTMTEGKLARWLKAEGEAVKSGDVIAEIETDKATMEFEASDEGILARILVPAGTEKVAINTPIALILEEGEDASALGAPLPLPLPHPGPVAPVPAVPPGMAVPTIMPPPATPAGRRILSSPLARRLAKEGGLDIVAITGSGPHGRVIKRDIEQAIAHGAARAASPPPSPTATAPTGAIPMVAANYVEIPLTAMRKVIATRLTKAKRTIPHFYLTVDCRVDKLLAMRAELNARSSDYKLSVNDFIVRAVALALKKVPTVNASFAETAIHQYNDIDVAMAVAIPGGLLTPVVRQADRKGLAAISAESKDLAARARAGKLMPEEYQGGGFTISNLGMYGMRNFAAIINPPQAAILAVGASEQRPVVTAGALAVATVMTCTMAVDHRVVDGATGAEFLREFKILIEDPLTMLL